MMIIDKTRKKIVSFIFIYKKVFLKVKKIIIKYKSKNHILNKIIQPNIIILKKIRIKNWLIIYKNKNM